MLIKTPVDIGDSVHVIYEHYSNFIKVWDICQGTVVDMNLDVSLDKIKTVVKVKFYMPSGDEDEGIFLFGVRAFFTKSEATQALNKLFNKERYDGKVVSER